MALTIATWNINSIRLRMPIVEQFLKAHQPDILCLQETKCPNDLFPHAPLEALGYRHIAYPRPEGLSRGRDPFTPAHRGNRGTARLLQHRRQPSPLGDLHRRRQAYSPAQLLCACGGDEPDRTINPKFGHKLDFLEEMKLLNADADAGISSILVGDLNIAPLEHDVWSHKQLLKIVSHTPVETEGMLAMMTGGNWVDLMRQHTPEPTKLYTWWSYRAQDWANRRPWPRLDHIWSSADLAPHLTDMQILREARGWERPRTTSPSSPPSISDGSKSLRKSAERAPPRHQ